MPYLNCPTCDSCFAWTAAEFEHVPDTFTCTTCRTRIAVERAPVYVPACVEPLPPMPPVPWLSLFNGLLTALVIGMFCVPNSFVHVGKLIGNEETVCLFAVIVLWLVAATVLGWIGSIIRAAGRAWRAG